MKKRIENRKKDSMKKNIETLQEIHDNIRTEYEQIEGTLSIINECLEDMDNLLQDMNEDAEEKEAENIFRRSMYKAYHSDKSETQEKEGA